MRAAGGCLVVVTFLCLGCSSNNKGKLEGTAWKSLAIPADDVDDEAVPAGAIRIQFTKGGIVYLRGPRGNWQGKYTLGGGDWITIHLDRELDGAKIRNERVIIQGNQMIMIGEDGNATTFEQD